MRQTRAARRRPRPTGWPQTPLPPDPRDPDIVRAHQVTRRARTTPGRRQRDLPSSPRPPAEPGQEDTMHPLILQQLAAGHVNDMIAAAAGSRRARQPRRTRRSRTFRLTTQLGLPRSQAGLQPAASPAPARRGRRRALIAIRRFRWNPRPG